MGSLLLAGGEFVSLSSTRPFPLVLVFSAYTEAHRIVILLQEPLDIVTSYQTLES